LSRLIDAYLMELDQEAGNTRRLLEHVPADKLAWKPHAKSMSLGQLALHVASTPGDVAELLKLDTMETPDFGNVAEPESVEQVLQKHEESVTHAKAVLNDFDDDTVLGSWTLTKGGEEVMTVPRIGLARSILLNHWYHHRGQLSVYLRLLDAPVPATFGPSADENPFDV
jgi:uncharacterized damage-inducible protein DinB